MAYIWGHELPVAIAPAAEFALTESGVVVGKLVSDQRVAGLAPSRCR